MKFIRITRMTRQAEDPAAVVQITLGVPEAPAVSTLSRPDLELAIAIVRRMCGAMHSAGCDEALFEVRCGDHVEGFPGDVERATERLAILESAWAQTKS